MTGYFRPKRSLKIHSARSHQKSGRRARSLKRDDLHRFDFGAKRSYRPIGPACGGIDRITIQRGSEMVRYFQASGRKSSAAFLGIASTLLGHGEVFTHHFVSVAGIIVPAAGNGSIIIDGDNSDWFPTACVARAEFHSSLHVSIGIDNRET